MWNCYGPEGLWSCNLELSPEGANKGHRLERQDKISRWEWFTYFINYKSVFEMVGKFQSHGQNRAQRLRDVMLWQILTYYMQYFWFSWFFYNILWKCHLFKNSSISDERARKVRKVNFSKNHGFGPTLIIGHPV